MYEVLCAVAGTEVSPTARLWEMAWPTTADAELSGTAARPTREKN